MMSHRFDFETSFETISFSELHAFHHGVMFARFYGYLLEQKKPSYDSNWVLILTVERLVGLYNV